MRWGAGLAVPCRKSVPQIMPTEIENPSTLQRIAPGLGIDLHNGLALVGENVRRVVSLAFFQHIDRRLVPGTSKRVTVPDRRAVAFHRSS